MKCVLFIFATLFMLASQAFSYEEKIPIPDYMVELKLNDWRAMTQEKQDGFINHHNNEFKNENPECINHEKKIAVDSGRVLIMYWCVQYKYKKKEIIQAKLYNRAFLLLTK